jgi:ribosomal protein S12 methylthiotransferase accessory factor
MDMIVTFPGGKRVDASFGGFVVRTDQPQSGGGEGSAPTPFNLFLASLATCAGIFVLGFCQTRNIPTDGIQVIQKHEMDEATHKLKKVPIEVVVPPSFPEKYHAAVQRVANLCLVKKTILEPPEFEVKTVVEG